MSRSQSLGGRPRAARASSTFLQACVLFGVVGCDATTPGRSEPFEVSESVQNIIDGMPEMQSQSVVAVFSRNADASRVALCSGSVIGPYHVLTAKHCIHDDDGERIPNEDFNVVVGHDLTTPAGIDGIAKVSEIRMPPGDDIDRDVRNGDDIAILLLPTRLTPTPLHTATGTPELGSAATIVGFGRTMSGVPDEDDAEIKFIGTTTITAFDSRLIQTEGQSATCEGDSGGPLLDASGAVAGITSFGLNMECFGATSLFTRVSRHRVLIESAMAWTPRCPDAKPEVCNGRDDNCDGIVDEVCIPIGAPCDSNAQCEGGLCASLDGQLRCTSACDPSEALPDCPTGSYCRALACGVGRCFAGVPGELEDGAECREDVLCAAGHCGSVDGKRVCGRVCKDGGDACPMGQLCDTSDGASGCGTCVPVSISRELRPFAAPCEAASECESGMCQGAGSRDAFCTRVCELAEGCGNNFHCRERLCVAGALGTSGSSCVDDSDCGATAPECVEHESDRVCAPRCDDDTLCGPAFECVGGSGETRHCLRAGAALGAVCESGGQCATGVCREGACVRACSQSSPCPVGFTCESAMDGPSFCSESRHVQRNDEGCSVGAATPSWSSSGALTLVLGWRLRRRRTTL